MSSAFNSFSCLKKLLKKCDFIQSWNLQYIKEVHLRDHLDFEIKLVMTNFSKL